MSFMTETANKYISCCSRQVNAWAIEYDAFQGAGDPLSDTSLLADFFLNKKWVFAKTAAGWQDLTSKKNSKQDKLNLLAP